MEHYHIEEAPRVLVVDDERVIREVLVDFLTMEGFLVKAVDNGLSALQELESRPYNLILSDLKMPKMGGLELLDSISGRNSDTIVVIMTGYGTVQTAIEAMKRGAYDYIMKPFKMEDVVHVIRRGLERQRLQAENIQLREALALYHISEAVNSSLSVDHILEIIVETTVREVGADVVLLLLRKDEDDAFVESIHRASPRFQEREGLMGDLNFPALMDHFSVNKPVFAHGAKAFNFFIEPPSQERLISLISIPLKSRQTIIGMLNTYSFTPGHKFSEGHRKTLTILASRASVQIENARLYENLQETFRQTIQGLARALEAKDKYTRGHSERVTRYSRLIAEGLGMSPEETEVLCQAALMHDIGKMGIRYEDLNKPGSLNETERVMIMEHPVLGRDILAPISFLKELIPAIYHHHERLDGSGYPEGLAGDAIPFSARILAVADTYDAMTSDRAYRKAIPHQEAVEELERYAGIHFDPRIVEVFLGGIDNYRQQCLDQGEDIPR